MSSFIDALLNTMVNSSDSLDILDVNLLIMFVVSPTHLSSKESNRINFFPILEIGNIYKLL